MQEIKVSAREEGGTLLKLLGKYLKTAPASFFYKMLRKKNITLNGMRAEGKERLVKGDVIRLFLGDDTIRQFGGQAWLDAAGGKAGDGAGQGKGRESGDNARQDEDRESGNDARQDEGREAGNCVGKNKTRHRKGKETELFVGDGANWKPCVPAGMRGQAQPKILYEDDDLLLVGKPAGWLTQKAGADDFSLNEWVIEYLVSTGSITRCALATFRPGVCNRLDRNTSGIVCAGKTLAGLQFFSEAFRTRALHKYYTCIVVGELHEPAHLTGYLRKDGTGNMVHVLSWEETATAGCERIELAYRPLAAAGGLTYLEVELITGKTHQIRAQLASAGHVLLGDTKYTDAAGSKLCRQYHLKHQLLHAGRLVFGQAAGRFSYLSGREFLETEPDDFLAIKKRLEF